MPEAPDAAASAILVRDASERIRAVLRDAGHGLVDRAGLLETIVLAAVAREHVLVIGPPGTAKSEAVRRVATGLGGRTFEYLLGRFTEPSELFGPVDLRRLKEGVVETETSGMLPEADIAFLDEIFQGSTAILNTLLGILNERVFRRGHTVRQCPLRVCVGAANAVPTDDTLAAFADRFLVRVFVHDVGDTQLEALLEAGWQGASQAGTARGAMADLDVLQAAARAVDLGPVRPLVAQAVRRLRKAGLALSDRRIVKTQHLVAAASALNGRSLAGPADLWPVVLAVPTEEGQAVARECLRDLLSQSENAVLLTSAEETSAGPAARAGRLRAEAEALPTTVEDEATALRLEGLGREIDATFSDATRPADLGVLRDRVRTLLDAWYRHA